MEQDLINAVDILPLEDHKGEVSYKLFTLFPLPFTRLFIFFYLVVWKPEDVERGGQAYKFSNLSRRKKYLHPNLHFYPHNPWS